jgi:alkaline phosphatase D
MRVECSSVESFKTIIGAASIDALLEHDCTAKLLLQGLPPGQDIFYRVWSEDIADAIAGESQTGHFRTAPGCAATADPGPAFLSRFICRAD